MPKGSFNGASSKQDTRFFIPSSNPIPGSVQKVIIPSDVTKEVNLTDLSQSQILPDPALNAHSSRMPLSPTKQPSKKTPSSSHGASFQRYEESTLDAWDDGDDDLLVRLKLDSNMIQSTASQVINNHSVTNTPPKQTTHSATAKDQTTGKSRKEKPSSCSEVSTQPVKSQSLPPSNGIQRSVSASRSKRQQAKEQKFETLLHSPPNNVLDELKPLSWSGIPNIHRPITWKILCGYLPAALDRRKVTLERKRNEYFGFLEKYFDTRTQDHYQDIFRQIHIDVPRMNPLVPLFQNKQVQEMFERILYIWAIRHPASGYVQGINDLVTPFFVVFLTEFLEADTDFKDIDISPLTKEQLDMIEADSFWCMSKLLDGIQDNYTFAQPGIQTKVSALKELTLRIDANLHNHIERQGIEFLQFTFRWMNNLLMRELPLRCTIRLWDTYLAEPEGFASYHLYVCAAFLTSFSKQLLQQSDFQGLMTSLQNLPTSNWQDSEIEELTAEAYRLKYMFADAPQHFKQKT